MNAMTNQRHSDESPLKRGVLFRASASWLNSLENSLIRNNKVQKWYDDVRDSFHSANSFSYYNGSFWDWSLDNEMKLTFDNVSFLCCVLNNESDIISNLQRCIKFMLNTKSVIKYFKAWHPYGTQVKSRILCIVNGSFYWNVLFWYDKMS